MGSMQDGQGLFFCRGCGNADAEGLFVDTWENAFRPPQYHVDAEIVYAVPNDASAPLLNQVGGCIVLVHRGVVGFHEKAMHAQNAGAVGVLIADTTGNCTETFACGSWLGSRAAHEMNHDDDPRLWNDVVIPVVLITNTSLQRIRAHLEPRSIMVEGFSGPQWYSD